jgi:hypothetical protein
MTMSASTAPIVYLFRPQIRAHVPPPPDPQQPPGNIPPDSIPPGSPDREVDLPPRERPDDVREPMIPPTEDPPVHTLRAVTSSGRAFGLANNVGNG